LSTRWVVLYLFLAATLGLYAQSESGRAAIEGSVSDPSGMLIPSAAVTIQETQTGLQRKLTTNTEGQFRAAALPVGTYIVEATASGFGTVRVENLGLTVGETKSVNVTLQIAPVSTQVTVVEQAQLVNAADSSNSVTVGQRAIEDLPLRARNFTEFAQLSPNVTQEGNRFGIVVNGQRSINANISIDGVDFNDPLQNGPRGGGPKESAFFFPQLAIREFQVVTNGASAEPQRCDDFTGCLWQRQQQQRAASVRRFPGRAHPEGQAVLLWSGRKKPGDDSLHCEIRPSHWERGRPAGYPRARGPI
jgi:hypothetical protein